jgi:hypothetical protein
MRARLAVALLGGLTLAGPAAALAGCSGPPARPAPAPARPAPSASASAATGVPANPPPATTKALTTDGCRGLVTTAQVARATGLPLAPGTGDGQAAAAQYTQAVRAQGLSATSVRLCPFTDPAGDQLMVVGMAFPDAGQAGRMYDSGSGAASMRDPRPVPGVGDAAVTDRSHTLLARRGRAVVMVYLVRAPEPDADHVRVLSAVASAAFGSL